MRKKICILDLNSMMGLDNFYKELEDRGVEIDHMRILPTYNAEILPTYNTELKIPNDADVIISNPSTYYIQDNEGNSGFKKFIVENRNKKIFIVAPRVEMEEMSELVKNNKNIELILSKEDQDKGMRFDNLMKFSKRLISNR